MSTEKVRGIVIREVMVGESDKIITLLTKEQGKMSLSARGARKSTSKYLSSCEVFAYSDFVVFTARKHPAVSSAELIDSFYGLRTSIEGFSAAAYLCDFCNKMIFEGTDCSDVMLLLLMALKNIEKGETKDYMFIVTVFELKFLALGGMLPEFDYSPEGEISQGAAKAMSYIANSETEKVFSFRVTDKIFSEMKLIRDKLFAEQVDVGFKTYDFFKQLF